MVTRPADQAQEMYKTLRYLGAEVLAYPTIATEEYKNSDGWIAYKKVRQKDCWLIFTSENGVRYFFKQFAVQVGDIRNLGGIKIAGIGYGTQRALNKLNLKPDFTPTKATTADFAKEFTSDVQLNESTVVRVRGNLADDTIEKALHKSGAIVVPLQVYETFHPDWPKGIKEKLFEYIPDIITFTSGSTAYGLRTMLSEDEVKKLTGAAIIISIGPATTKIIKSLGMHVTCEATEHNVPGVIDAIRKYFKK